MKKFEKEYLFLPSGCKVTEGVNNLKNVIQNSILTPNNLYLSISISKSNKYQYLSIKIAKNSVIDFESIINYIKTFTFVKSVETFDSKEQLSCIFGENNLTDFEYVQLLKDLYLNNEKITEISYEEGDDENFVSPTLHHYNIEFEAKNYNIVIPKSIIF